MKSLRILGLIVALSVGTQASAGWLTDTKAFFGKALTSVWSFVTDENGNGRTFVKENAIAIGTVTAVTVVSIAAVFGYKPAKAKFAAWKKAKKEALEAQEREKNAPRDAIVDELMKQGDEKTKLTTKANEQFEAKGRTALVLQLAQEEALKRLDEKKKAPAPVVVAPAASAV